MHIPVLVKEVIEILNPQDGEIVCDLTVGGGGHAVEFAKRIGKSGKLILIDCDKQMLSIAEKRVTQLPDPPEIFLVNSNFSRIDEIFQELWKEEKILPNIFFADLGISSYQLENPEYGLSFRIPGTLDMRISKDVKITAQDVIANFSEREIARILRTFGEEKFGREIAKEIVTERKKRKIERTDELAEIVERVYKRKGIKTKIHPATKTFMALRIFINSEIENLSKLLEKLPQFTKGGTRVGIISFHSIEDRIVKNNFLQWERSSLGKTITKKPITPSEEEVILNPRSRSAKFRAFFFSPHQE